MMDDVTAGSAFALGWTLGAALTVAVVVVAVRQVAKVLDRTRSDDDGDE